MLGAFVFLLIFPPHHRRQPTQEPSKITRNAPKGASMRTLRDFWRRRSMVVHTLSAADVIGVLIMCAVALLAIAVWFGR